MSISRRTALLATGAAAITAGVVTAPLASKAALAADPVIELAAQVKAAYRASCEADDAYEAAAHDAGHNICADFDTTTVTAINGQQYGWSRDAVLFAASPGGYMQARVTPEERDRALAVIDADQRKVARVRHDLGLGPIKERKDRTRAHWRELEARLLDTPALTVAGVLAKLQAWYGDHEIEDMRSGGYADPLPEEYAASVYRDLERLTGGASS